MVERHHQKLLAEKMKTARECTERIRLLTLNEFLEISKLFLKEEGLDIDAKGHPLLKARELTTK